MKKNLSICIITPRAKVHSGGEKSMLELVDSLLEKGVTINMIVLEKEGQLFTELDKRGIRYTYVSADFWVGMSWEKDVNEKKRFAGIFESSMQIAKIVKDWKCDVVYTNTSVINVGNIAATILDKPHIWHIRESIKDNQAYKLLMDFENYAGHISTSNNIVIFISEYLKNQYKDYEIFNNFKKVINHVDVINQDLKPAPDNIKVDVIIPFYNDKNTIPCLESIIENKSESLSKVIIVDDQGPDLEIREMVKNFAANYDWMEVIENDKNRGFVHSCNQGMKYSENDVILLNTDTLVTKNWIEKLKTIAYQDDKFGTVTPLSNAASYYSIPDQFAKEHDGRPEESNEIVELVSPFEYVESHTGHGFCYYIKRSIINEFGMFDEKTFGKGYGEENDYSMRIYKAGYKNIISTKTYIYHLEGQSFATTSTKSKKELMAPNREKLLKKHPEILPLEREFHKYDYFQEIKILFKYFKANPNLIMEDKICVVGSISPNKGQLDAVKAIAELSKRKIKVNLLLAGEIAEKSYYEEIQAFIKKNSISDQIHFLGTLDRPFSVIKMSKVGLMTSQNEAWGRATLEYMLLGKPVIGTQSGGTTELIEDGETGYLYESGNIKALSDYIEKILSNDSLANKLGEAGKKKALELNNNNYGEEIYKIIEEVSRDKNQGRGMSAFLSPWFLASVFNKNILQTMWYSFRYGMIKQTFIYKSWRKYKEIRANLSLKKRIYRLFGKEDEAYGKKDKK